MRRENTSRPSTSLPSQCSALGSARLPSMSMSVGLGIGSRSAKMAPSATRAIQISEAMNRPPTRRRRPSRATGEVSTPTSSAAPSRTAMADPGVEDGVKHVDDEVHHHEADGDEQHRALQDDEVASVDRADQQPANARQGEDRFDDHRAA